MLRVDKDASTAEIKEAFLKLSKQVRTYMHNITISFSKIEHATKIVFVNTLLCQMKYNSKFNIYTKFAKKLALEKIYK